jgi:hypothetical protein
LWQLLLCLRKRAWKELSGCIAFTVLPHVVDHSNYLIVYGVHATQLETQEHQVRQEMIEYHTIEMDKLLKVGNTQQHRSVQRAHEHSFSL